MANQNQKVENKTVEEQKVEQPVQQNEVPQQPAPVQKQAAPAEPAKEGLMDKLKKHWKGVTAVIVGAGLGVGSAFVAYKKGKAAGIMSCPTPEPQQDPDEYSLDPNR